MNGTNEYRNIHLTYIWFNYLLRFVKLEYIKSELCGFLRGAVVIDAVFVVVVGSGSGVATKSTVIGISACTVSLLFMQVDTNKNVIILRLCKWKT